MSSAKKTIASKKDAVSTTGSEERDSTSLSSNQPEQANSIAHKSISAQKRCDCSSCQTRRGPSTNTRSLKQTSALNQLASGFSSSMNGPTRDREPSAELRSTLAIGELIASNRPTAGSRLIANELRHLSNVFQGESLMLRTEIADLTTTLSTTLKTIFEDDQRGTGAFGRVPLYTQNMGRGRFPVFRRPRRIPLQFARKSVVNAWTTTSPQATVTSPPTTSTKTPSRSPQVPATSTTPTTATTTTTSTVRPPNSLAGITAKKVDVPTIRDLHQIIAKNLYLSQDRDSSSYDGEADTDSSDTTPNSTP